MKIQNKSLCYQHIRHFTGSSVSRMLGVCCRPPNTLILSFSVEREQSGISPADFSSGPQQRVLVLEASCALRSSACSLFGEDVRIFPVPTRCGGCVSRCCSGGRSQLEEELLEAKAALTSAVQLTSDLGAHRNCVLLKILASPSLFPSKYALTCSLRIHTGPYCSPGARHQCEFHL